MPSTLAPAAAQPEPTFRDILDAVNGLGTEVAGQKITFDRLEMRFDALEIRFDALETRMDALETRFGELEARFDRLETKVDRLETRFNRLETRFEAFEAEVGQLRSELAALTALSHEQLAHATGEAAAIRAEGVQVRQQLEVLDRRTSEMHAEVARISNIESTTLVVRSEIDMLTRVVHRMEPQVVETLRLGQDNRKLGQKLQEGVTRLDRKLEGHLDDHEIQLPRPRTVDLPEADSIAA
jgi:chromosome segregation ATPase